LSIAPDKEIPPRQGVVLLGTRAWAEQCVVDSLEGCGVDGAIWIAEQAPEHAVSVRPAHIGRCLGSEYQALVYDAHQNFHPDVLAASLGTLCGGGVLYLLLPDTEDWPSADDAALKRLAPWPLDGSAVGRRFFDRLLSRLGIGSCFQVVRQGQPIELPVPVVHQPPGWSLNPDQEQVVEAIERVALGHARRPLVLTADRGRGKSTSIGAALARLVEKERQVLLCGPSEDAVQAVFDQLARELPDAEYRDHTFRWGGGGVHFRLVYEQLQDPLPCDLLVVDEAAALGLSTLATLARSHNRLVFSTTVHGYEGSGRGFLLRFMQVLKELMPRFRQLRLYQPVRWAADDPLERWLNDTLMLEAEPGTPSSLTAPEYRWVTQDELAADETLLRQVFGLLVTAHYQTRPSDLQQLLDAPGLHLLLARDGAAMLGVALLVDEGGFDADLAGQVCRGKRRPRGHLLLQSLAQHAGCCEAPTLRGLRVMRIAVQESVRRRRIGSGLLEAIGQFAAVQKYDLLGAAFGLDAALLPFWQRLGYQVVRIGYRVDPASGAHSAQLLKGKSEAGCALVNKARNAFQRDLPWRLQRELAGLPESLISMLLAGASGHGWVPDARDLDTVRVFADGGRGYADAYPSLWRWTLEETARDSTGMDELVRHVLMRPGGHMPDRELVGRLRSVILKKIS